MNLHTQDGQAQYQDVFATKLLIVFALALPIFTPVKFPTFLVLNDSIFETYRENTTWLTC